MCIRDRVIAEVLILCLVEAFSLTCGSGKIGKDLMKFCYSSGDDGEWVVEGLSASVASLLEV